MEEETRGLSWCTSTRRIKERLIESEPVVPREELWRIKYLGKLLEKRDTLVYQGLEESDQVELLQSLIDSLCTN